MSAAPAVRIGPEEVVVTQTPVASWAVAADGGETVALEVTITPELRREGLAREFIRLVQDARKGDGLAVTDRISLRWSTADPSLADALAEHQLLISKDVLAVEFGPASPDAVDDTVSPAYRHESTELALTFWIQRR